MWDCPITDLYQVLVQVPALAPFVRAFRAQQDLTEEKLTNTLDGHGVLQAELSTAQKEAVAQAAAEMNQEHQTRQECIIGSLKRQFEAEEAVQEILTEEAEWRQHREAALAQKIKDIGRREHVSVLNPTNTLMDFATIAIM
jgi:ribosome-binding ATPase YchF (GTP1/OBG family)